MGAPPRTLQVQVSFEQVWIPLSSMFMLPWGTKAGLIDLRRSQRHHDHRHRDRDDDYHQSRYLTSLPSSQPSHLNPEPAAGTAGAATAGATVQTVPSTFHFPLSQQPTSAQREPVAADLTLLLCACCRVLGPRTQRRSSPSYRCACALLLLWLDWPFNI